MWQYFEYPGAESDDSGDDPIFAEDFNLSEHPPRIDEQYVRFLLTVSLVVAVVFTGCHSEAKTSTSLTSDGGGSNLSTLTLTLNDHTPASLFLPPSTWEPGDCDIEGGC